MYLNTRQLMSDTKFYEGYSRWDEELGRYETWNESVLRVMNMHKKYYEDKLTPQLLELIEEATSAYQDKLVLGAQRALQFGGDQILKNHMKMYNCTSTYADRPEFFGEIFWVMLCGAGAGFSVQKHHISKLPKIKLRTKQPKLHVVEDSIEGWATALDVLMASFFEGGGKYPEYEGRRVYFDLSLIRLKNSMISGGFKAPGPEPLRLALDKIEYLLQGLTLSKKGGIELKPIHVYDIVMYAADAVISGGVRRSATICLFSPEDEEMATAKTGNWFTDNPQRGRSNNSAVIVRSKITREKFASLMKSVKEFGEPGFVFVDSEEHVYNPCVEIGMFPQYEGQTGWQGCNLVETNGGMCSDIETFYRACKVGAIIGTLQAGYTTFNFLPETSKKIFEREALLGVSITGWMNNPAILFDEEVLRTGAEIVKKTNKIVAEMIGINPAARTTCSKPSGNASVLLMTASGIGGEHAPMYLRNMQLNKDTEVAQLIKKTNPYMVEESVWSANKTDYVVSFPVIAPETSIFNKDLLGVKHLELIAKAQKNWVEAGTNLDLCVDPTVRHNISNTVTVDDWDTVEEYVFNHKETFAGISFLAGSGDKDYDQAPFTKVMSGEEIIEYYGTGAIFASGLVVEALRAFGNLWTACSAVYGIGADISSDDHDNLLKKDWIRRFEKYRVNYFSGVRKDAEYCLKDVYLLHKWEKIQQNLVDIDWENSLFEKKYIDVSTTGAAACVGNGADGCLI